MSGKKLWNIEAELRALKTVLTQGNAFGTKLFPQLKIEHFYGKASRALFERLAELMGRGLQDLPTWEMLVTDTNLSEDVKAALTDNFQQAALVSSDGDYQYLLEELINLGGKRAIYASVIETQDILFDPKKTAAEAISKISDLVTSIEVDDDTKTEMGIGSLYNANAENIFNDIVFRTDSNNFIKTGYPTFDTRSGGHQRGNLVLIGANSGGGKSVYALNLMARQYKLGYNVVMASYEMNYQEIGVRLLSQISEVDMMKIQTKKLSVEEIRKVECSWREFNMLGMKNGNSFNLICPSGETTVAEIGLKYKSRKPDCIIFDYLNLLTSHSELAESQWQMLGEIAREAKILAKRMECVVYLLVQIDEQHNFKYAKAIKDHANWAMGWVLDDQAKLDGFVTVKQMKARNAPTYDYQMLLRLDISTLRDIGEQDKNTTYSNADYTRILDESTKLGVMLDLSPPTPAVCTPKVEAATITAETKPKTLEDIERPDEARSMFNPDKFNEAEML